MDLSLKIDVVKNITKEEFQIKYFNTQTPVIIKGLTDHTFAGKKWSIDYFKENMGETELDIYDNKNKNAAATAFTKADLRMKLKDFLSIITKDEPTDLRIFLCNLFKYNPHLKEEFPCPELFHGFLDQIGYMFFGGKNTRVRIHYDVDLSNVLHTHFGGRKRVVLFAPQYSTLLYRLPLNTYSLIDPDRPDYDKYPGLRFVKGYDLVLEPGDSIFMPAGYWHYMTYLEGSFSVSYRKLSGNFKDPLEGLWNLLLCIPIDKTMNKVFGKKWLERKNSLAEKKAKQFIEKTCFEDFPESLGI